MLMKGFILSEHSQEEITPSSDILVIYSEMDTKNRDGQMKSNLTFYPIELEMVKRNKINIFPNQAANFVDTFKT